MMRFPGCACFWLEPTFMVRLSLRRFTFSVTPGKQESRAHRNCPADKSGHDASVDLGREIPLRVRQEEYGAVMESVPEDECPPHDDPRWPTVCAACGESFRDDDEWQVNQAEVYVRGDTGERVATRGYGDITLAGALYDAWWLHDRIVRNSQGVERHYVGPDGIALVAICPNGSPWEVDGPSRAADGTLGPGWSRTGDPRRPGTLSVTPSIVNGTGPGGYHGFLTAGRFTDDLGS
jgi:hypothetical protein